MIVSESRTPSELSKALSKSTESTAPLISLLLSNQKEGANSILLEWIDNLSEEIILPRGSSKGSCKAILTNRDPRSSAKLEIQGSICAQTSHQVAVYCSSKTEFPPSVYQLFDSSSATILDDDTTNNSKTVKPQNLIFPLI